MSYKIVKSVKIDYLTIASFVYCLGIIQILEWLFLDLFEVKAREKRKQIGLTQPETW